jgi:hypothetical protein
MGANVEGFVPQPETDRTNINNMKCKVVGFFPEESCYEKFELSDEMDNLIMMEYEPFLEYASKYFPNN